MARSNLLDRYGRTGFANTILGTIELANGDYQFTILLIKLTDSLVTESLLQDSSIVAKTKNDILEKLIAHLLHIYESYHFWKFNDIKQRFEIGYHLTDVFSKIVYNVYGIDPLSAPTDKITNILTPSGFRIIDTFLSGQSPDSLAASTLLNILISSKIDQISFKGNKSFGSMYSKLIKKSFQLTDLLISVRGLLNMSPSTLEKMLFSNSQKLVDIYNSVYELKSAIINLLDVLIGAPWDDNYPFLLSYLGEAHSELLFDSIAADLQSALEDYKLSKRIYPLFSTLMQSKQDGLAILFLTGKTASNKSFNEETKDIKSASNSSIFTILKQNALRLGELPESVGSRLLDAIAYAFNTWTNARILDKDTEFISALVKILNTFEPQKSGTGLTKEETVILSNRYRLISRIVEIFALYLYTSSDVNSKVYELLNRDDLSKIIKPFFQIDGYNQKLHDSINENFERYWPKYKLSSFALSPLSKSVHTFQNNAYDIEMMDQLFSQDEKWIGNGQEKGFREDVIIASLNLQYVHHQISAAKAWGALLTTFLKVTTTTPLKDTFLDITSYFLDINIKHGIGKPIFKELYLERIELCFYILFSMQATSKMIPEKTLTDLLSQLITIFKSDDIDYLGNLSVSNRSNNFYKPILRSILILLSLATTGKHFVELTSDQLLECFECAFSKGVHLILSEILSDMNAAAITSKETVIYNLGERIQDLFLLLSLFSKMKALSPPETFKAVMASSLDEIGTMKVILNLYSSAHSINVNDEPIIGHIVLTFISELCTIQAIAERFIANGLFTVLLESPLSVVIQNGNIKPELQARLHNIWSNGLLSIILLLLSELGTKVLPECCLFVSYFHKQIKTAVFSWSDNKLAVSTALIRETTQLVLLQKMLDALDYKKYLRRSRVNTVNAEDDSVELVRGLDSDYERKDLSVVLNKLLTHPKYLNSRIIPSSLEEQHLLEEEGTRLEFVKKICKQIKELQESLFKEL